MAVDALELRPRNAVALVDAALRVCATTTGVWALTLPSGALLVAALFSVAESARAGAPLAWPVAWLTLAWCARAVAQGAACHHVEQLVVGQHTPPARASLAAALARAPALVTAAAWLAAVNTLLWVSTFGLGFLFFGAHAAGYAATMRGQGSVLGLYGTCSRLLGAARHQAPWVRLLGLAQLLLALNLHVTTSFALSLGSSLFGFDVTFLQRFASADNPTWLAVVAAVTFALYEPLRAATAALLLIDGRVRQEGLDLLAQAEQLPRRGRARGVALGAALALLALPAAAAPEAHERAREVVEACELDDVVDLTPLEVAPRAEEQSALARFLLRVERAAFDDDDCATAEAELRGGLGLYAELQASRAEGVDARAAAAAILARPEFQATPPKPERAEEPDGPDEPGWLSKLIRDFFKWLFDLGKDREAAPSTAPELPTGMAGANVVMVVALVLVAAVLIFILVRSVQRGRRVEVAPDEQHGLTEQPLHGDAMSALARAPETWAGLADELAARGHFREAIRHLYLALLSRLHRDGVIDYDPTRSNWEYLLAFKGPGATKSTFRELTRRFDFAWYGNLGVDALAYSVFRQLTAPLLSPGEGAPRHA